MVTIEVVANHSNPPAPYGCGEIIETVKVARLGDNPSGARRLRDALARVDGRAYLRTADGRGVWATKSFITSHP